MDSTSLEFTAAYKSTYKDKFHDNAEKYFDELVTKAEINVEENRSTAKHYRVIQGQADDLSKQLSKKRSLRKFLIALTVIGSVFAVLFTYLAVVNQILWVIGSVLAVGIFVMAMVLMFTKINPAIRNLNGRYDDKAAEAAKLKTECLSQLKSLFQLFDNYCTFGLIEKTLPLLKFDRNFNVRRYGYFYEKYGVEYVASSERSTVDVFSGEINGNPFFLQKEFDMDMGLQKYTGSLTITWTEIHRDSQGNAHTVTRTQTLHASVEKPKPFYSYFTRLVYANDAAPDLSFSRQPGHAERLSERELAHKIKSGQKQIQKLSAKSVGKGGSFTELGNPEFDVLFNALDRDHEVQFRLMFTPLAQKNLLQLMKDPYPYGDDFHFIKDKRVNYIASEHSQSFDYTVNTSRFISYDIDVCKQLFMNYNEEFFRSLYFEFAPLMAVPLYQQYKPTEYIYGHQFESNHTMYEAEVLANRLDVSLLQHPDTKTDVILSASFVQKKDSTDTIAVDAYSFDTEEMVDYVAVFGGDGRYHDVPVHWIKYIPIANRSFVSIDEIPEEQDNKHDARNGDSATRHGLLATLLKL